MTGVQGQLQNNPLEGDRSNSWLSGQSSSNVEDYEEMFTEAPESY